MHMEMFSCPAWKSLWMKLGGAGGVRGNPGGLCAQFWGRQLGELWHGALPGALSAAEQQLLIRTIKSSCNTSSNDTYASGALLGGTWHGVALHRARTWRPLPRSSRCCCF